MVYSVGWTPPPPPTWGPNFVFIIGLWIRNWIKTILCRRPLLSDEMFNLSSHPMFSSSSLKIQNLLFTLIIFVDIFKCFKHWSYVLYSFVDYLTRRRSTSLLRSLTKIMWTLSRTITVRLSDYFFKFIFFNMWKKTFPSKKWQRFRFSVISLDFRLILVTKSNAERFCHIYRRYHIHNSGGVCPPPPPPIQTKISLISWGFSRKKI